MYCPKCRTENPREAHSCLCCGAPLEAVAGGAPLNPGEPAYAIPSPEHFRSGGWGIAASYQQPWESEENSSGWGDTRQAPPWARGWSFAGALPFGLFAFCNGSQSLGVIGMLLTVFGLPFVMLLWPFSLGYIVYLGLKGRELAWRGRRFAGRRQYEQTMRVWHVAGALAMIVVPALYLVWIVALISSLGDLSPLFDGTAGSGGYT
jgi:hypothetical protein